MKCKILTIGKAKKLLRYGYTLNGTRLERVSNIKDLGIVIQSELNWNKHVRTLIASANRTLGLIKRTVGFKAPMSVKKQLYITLVRTKLEYCSPVWGGLSKTNAVKLERIQRDATRYILDYPDFNYKERLLELNLLPLSFRREISDVNFFFKCLNNLYSLAITNFVAFTRQGLVNTRANSDPNTLCVPKCKTVLFSKTYFNRIVNTWNTLPLSLRSSNEFSVFKRNIHRYVKQFMFDNFNPDRVCTWYLTCSCSYCRV